MIIIMMIIIILYFLTIFLLFSKLAWQTIISWIRNLQYLNVLVIIFYMYISEWKIHNVNLLGRYISFPLGRTSTTSGQTDTTSGQTSTTGRQTNGKMSTTSTTSLPCLKLMKKFTSFLVTSISP